MACVVTETVKTTVKTVASGVAAVVSAVPAMARAAVGSAASTVKTVVSNIGTIIKERVGNTEKISSDKWSDNSVYIKKLKDDPTVIGYVGRTNDPDRREKEHYRDETKDDLLPLEVIATGMSKDEARILEQVLISSYILENLHNARREIAVGKVESAMKLMNNSIRLLEGFTNDELINLMEGN